VYVLCGVTILVFFKPGTTGFIQKVYVCMRVCVCVCVAIYLCIHIDTMQQMFLVHFMWFFTYITKPFVTMGLALVTKCIVGKLRRLRKCCKSC